MKKISLNEIIGIVILLFLVGTILYFGLGSKIIKSEPVSAEDIYPFFICPCCGESIDTGCCDMAIERKAYVDSLVKEEKTEDEVILAYIKKYGLDSFKDKTKKEEFREKLVQEAPEDRAQIVVEPLSQDLGDISQKQGITTVFFEIKNKGNKNLMIDRLETSCGCTSASIIYREKEGPKFSMPGHGINEKVENWQVSIPAGKSVQLKVYYDSSVHSDFRGTAIREIYIFSNDPINFETKVRIELNQVD